MAQEEYGIPNSDGLEAYCAEDIERQKRERSASQPSGGFSGEKKKEIIFDISIEINSTVTVTIIISRIESTFQVCIYDLLACALRDRATPLLTRVSRQLMDTFLTLFDTSHGGNGRSRFHGILRWCPPGPCSKETREAHSPCQRRCCKSVNCMSLIYHLFIIYI